MGRFKIEVEDKEGRRIDILKAFGTIEKVNDFDSIVATEGPIIPLYSCDFSKIAPDQLYFPNFRKEEEDSTLIIII